MPEQKFKNLDDAAADAILQLIIGQRSFPRTMLDAASRQQLKPEFANLLLQDPRDNTFLSGPTQILGTPRGGNMNLLADLPTAAIVHTHPPTPDGSVFSEFDKNLAKGLDEQGKKVRDSKPVFMSQVGEKGQPALFRFDPDSGKTEEVLAQFPIERLAERLRAVQAQRNPIVAGDQISRKRNGRSN